MPRSAQTLRVLAAELVIFAGAQRALSQHVADLVAAAVVSEQIRRIHHRSVEMQIHATNAMVATLNRGIEVPGFATVSAQMRTFSRELEACLARLRAATVRWVAVLSHDVGAFRRRERLMLARAANPRSADAIASCIRVESTEGRTAVQRELVVVLDDARQLAATGCVLSRTAKLEAVYGGALSDSLSDAAQSFMTLADAVDESVRAIAQRLGRRTI